MFGFSVITRTR